MMNAGTVNTSTVLVLLLISIAGVPAKAARGGLSVPEFEVTVTGVRTIPVSIHSPRRPKGLPDTNFSKLRISPWSYWIELMPGDIEEIIVTVKNVDNRTISIDPKVIVSPYSEHPFAEDWIIMMPKIAELEPDSEEEFSFMFEIPGNAECGYYGVQVAFTGGVEQAPYPKPYPDHKNATVNLHLSVPAGVKGRYHGELDLNLDYPAAHEWYGETSVHLGSEVRAQPTEHFVKAFTTGTDAPIAIELVSNWWGRYFTYRSGSSHDECHFFDVSTAGPNGDTALTLNVIGIIIRGSVNLSGNDYIPPPTGLVWETGGGTCTIRHGEYREHYIAIAGSSIVDRELKMSSYIEEFEYAIKIGEAG